MKHKQSQDLIYIYDSERQKVIVIDGETGEQVVEQDDQVTSFLKYLREEGEIKMLRKFSVWCAHQINEELKPIQQKMLRLAEEAIQGHAGEGELRELYEETEGRAVATDTVGLRQGDQNAPGFLAARECINPDVLEGAIQAARFHRLWSVMQKEQEENKVEKEDKEQLKGKAKVLKQFKSNSMVGLEKGVEELQTDYLLDLMNK